ncbi:MAG: lysylphosphatidylglycerol synthase transmembrane domain-containing protein, partial [Dehalococcoidia bacterium]
IGALLIIVLVLSRGGLRWIANRDAVRKRVPAGDWLRAEAVSFAEGWSRLFTLRHVPRIWGWSAIAWLGAFAINYCLMLALGIDAPFTVAVLLTCTTNLAMLIPSSPGYIGVFHAAATLSLLPFGVGSSLAFSFAVLAHLVNVLPVSILGAAFLLWGRETANLGWRSNPPEPAVVE